MVYGGQGNEFAAYDMFIDYASDTKVQQYVNNCGTIVVSVLELKDGQLIKILSKPETYYRENMLEKGDQNDEYVSKSKEAMRGLIPLNQIIN